MTGRDAVSDVPLQDYDDLVDEYCEAGDTKHEEIAMQGAFERHGQTILQLLIAALLGWFGLQVVEQGRSTARMEVNVSTLTKQMDTLQTAYLTRTDERYRRSDADKDNKVIHDRLTNIDGRVLRLENMVHTHVEKERNQ